MVVHILWSPPWLDLVVDTLNRAPYLLLPCVAIIVRHGPSIGASVEEHDMESGLEEVEDVAIGGMTMVEDAHQPFNQMIQQGKLT
jgi:hypothetical protein